MNANAAHSCPSCSIQLTRRRAAAGTFLACTSCEGAVVNLAVLRQFVDERVVSSLWKRVRESRLPAFRACPTCTKRLRPFTVTIHGSEVELDGCLTCHALWFDGNELEQLKAAHLRVPTKAATKPRATSVVTAPRDLASANCGMMDGFDGLLLLVDLFLDL